MNPKCLGFVQVSQVISFKIDQDGNIWKNYPVIGFILNLHVFVYFP